MKFQAILAFMTCCGLSIEMATGIIPQPNGTPGVVAALLCAAYWGACAIVLVLRK